MRVNKPKSILYTGAFEWPWTSCVAASLSAKKNPKISEAPQKIKTLNTRALNFIPLEKSVVILKMNGTKHLWIIAD